MSWSDSQESCFILLFYAFIVVALLGGAIVFKYVSCHSKASKQGLECSYNPLQGCMVKIDGKWIDYNRLRVME